MQKGNENMAAHIHNLSTHDGGEGGWELGQPVLHLELILA